MRIDRVVLFGQSCSEGGAEAAAELAAHFEAELAYLFLEDSNLLRLAELPLAAEIGMDTACRRRLEPAAVERALRALASHAEEAVSGLARRFRIPWSFQVLRGMPAEALSEAASATDLIFFLRSQSRVGIPTREEALAREIVSRSGAAVLYLSGESSIQPPIGVFSSGKPSELPTLRLVAALARDFPAKLVVLCSASGGEVPPDPEFRELLRDAPSSTLRSGIPPKAWPILTAAAREGVGLLAISIGGSALPPGEIESICSQAFCPILLLP
ncbi:conserved protein of unknown function [Methylacidimicrobium sp. AP8]|uniref:hypothetical protein n=1 Tax=Methylacidimicrobium sp. AP8 TaxID=2730359 RepID=UPI0018C1AEA0|nr:hypothetical protein [Methylacidimicrobium sp. AP8]CAB4242613.1 conserved protein of unknown function [Methylacidimicrobium sp. AP8]